jgi:hypothetical protein
MNISEKVNMNKLYIVCFITSLFIITGCSNEEELTLPAIRTVIVYMSADNDLSADAFADLEEMKRGFSETGTNLIVFIDPIDENPRLMEIHRGKETVIKSYPEVNSADPDVFKEIIQEIAGLYPAEEYGLILWSHGTSWLPAGSPLRSFGNDSGKQMNIPALSAALPIRFDYILFDACLMGAVEVAYELRDKADYIISSSTETVAEGFPYDLIIPELIKQTPDLLKAATTYFDYYNKQSGANRSASVSVVGTQALEFLAREIKRLIEANDFSISSFDRLSVQRLDVYDEMYHFDLLDFVNKAFPFADKNAFVKQLNQTVLYKNSTPQFIMQYDINTYCGLSCYIPHLQRQDLNEYYQSLKWCEDSGFSYLLKTI